MKTMKFATLAFAKKMDAENLNQTELSIRTGISRQQINNILTGKAQPTLETLYFLIFYGLDIRNPIEAVPDFLYLREVEEDDEQPTD